MRNFEIPLSRLHIDQATPLGSGEFGVVYKVELYSEAGKKSYGENIVDCQVVAVKTVASTADIVYLKALLIELQMLHYIGSHGNLVNLIGACTTEVRGRRS